MPGTVIGINGLNYGYPGNVSRDGGGDPLITNRVVNATDVNSIPFGSAAALNQNNTFSLFGQASATLAVALVTTGPITSLSLNAPGLTQAVQAGQTITVGTGATADTFTVATTAQAGATTIAINSATPTNAESVGTPVVAPSTATQFAGIAVREVKQAITYNFVGQTPAPAQYAAGYPCDVLQRGTVTVTCNNGTPIAGGTVYVRVATNAAIPNGVIGGFEATADGTNTVALPTSIAMWKSGDMDSNNVTELVLLTRANA